MNHRKHLKRAHKQGAKDWAKRVAPVYLEQIAEVCRERDAALERAGAAEKRVKELEAQPASGWRFAAQGWPEKARESAREAADANGKLIAMTVERDTERNRANVAEREQRFLQTQKMELTEDIERMTSAWKVTCKHVAEFQAERDALRDNLAMLVARHDEVIAERDRLQSMIARATAAGYCDYSDTDEVAVALRAEEEADRTLGRLVRAMPTFSQLIRNTQYSWQYKRGAKLSIMSDTPQGAMRAAGITLPEETAADGVADGSKN